MEALTTYNEIKIEINTKDWTDVWACNYPCISNMKRWGWREKDGLVVKSASFPEDLTPSHRHTNMQAQHRRK